MCKRSATTSRKFAIRSNEMKQTNEQIDLSGVLAVGTYPPPVTGQAVAFGRAVDGLDLPYVDINSKVVRADKSFSPERVWEVLRQAATCWRKSKGKQTLYLTCATSRFGFIRDAMFILPAKLRGMRVLIHVHQGDFQGVLAKQPAPMRAFVRWVYRRIDRIIVSSARFLGQYDFVPKERLTAVPNGVPEEQPQANPPDEEVRVLYLSNLMPQKGIMELVESMAKLPPNYRLLIAGAPLICASDPYDSPEQFGKAVQDRIEELGLGERVSMLGVVYGDAKDRLLASSHVLALPTTYENELQPVCVIEAMMAAVPAVTTAHRDLRDMVDEDRGARIETPEPGQIADAILRATSSREEWQRRSNRAREVAVERYGLKTYLASLTRELTTPEK